VVLRSEDGGERMVTILVVGRKLVKDSEDGGSSKI
jgi:hypothetical protein